MSDIVKQIRESFETCIQTTLGDEWAKLDNKFELEKNNFYNQSKRYGVQFLSGVSSDSQLLKHISIDRNCIVTLTNDYISTINEDYKLQGCIDVLEDALDKILNVAVHSKLGIPALVLKTELIGINDPDFASIENLVILNINFAVSYRTVFTTC